MERQALVYAPADAKNRPTPLVFFFHGRKGEMDAAARGVAVHAKWPEAIVVYPQGLKSVKPSDPDSEYSTRWQVYIGDYGDRDLKFFDALIAGTAAHAGGLDALCQQWAEHIRSATPSASLRAFGAIAHLGQVAGFGQQPDVDTPTDEERKEEVLRNTEALIVSEPGLAVLVAQQIGWTVIPPG